MGRTKIKIRRLETALARQSTFTKRKHGIVNKVNDLSILCDVDVLALMFTPAGKPILCLGANSDLNSIVAKYELTTPDERETRARNSLKLLKKMFEKDHDNMEASVFRMQQIAELRDQLMMLRSQNFYATNRLSHWTNPETVNDTVLLKQMEEKLINSIRLLRERKEQLVHRERNGAPAPLQEQLFLSTADLQIEPRGLPQGLDFASTNRNAEVFNNPPQRTNTNQQFGMDELTLHVGPNPSPSHIASVRTTGAV